MKRFYLYFFVLCPFLGFSQAGNVGNIVTPGQLWNEISFNQGLNKKMVVDLSLQFSTSDNLKGDNHYGRYPIDIGSRAWLHYYFKPKIKLSASVGYWRNLEIPDLNQKPSSDYKIGLQFQHFITHDRLTFYNRVRLDERLRVFKSPNDIQSLTSFIYMPKLFVALNGKSIRSHTYYFIISDEIFFHINQGKFIDQNRITSGFGYCFTDDITLEATYINKVVNQPELENERTNILSFSLSFNNFLNMVQR